MGTFKYDETLSGSTIPMERLDCMPYIYTMRCIVLCILGGVYFLHGLVGYYIPGHLVAEGRFSAYIADAELDAYERFHDADTNMCKGVFVMIIGILTGCSGLFYLVLVLLRVRSLKGPVWKCENWARNFPDKRMVKMETPHPIVGKDVITTRRAKVSPAT